MDHVGVVGDQVDVAQRAGLAHVVAGLRAEVVQSHARDRMVLGHPPGDEPELRARLVVLHAGQPLPAAGGDGEGQRRDARGHADHHEHAQAAAAVEQQRRHRRRARPDERAARLGGGQPAGEDRHRDREQQPRLRPARATEQPGRQNDAGQEPGRRVVRVATAAVEAALDVTAGVDDPERHREHRAGHERSRQQAHLAPARDRRRHHDEEQAGDVPVPDVRAEAPLVVRPDAAHRHPHDEQPEQAEQAPVTRDEVARRALALANGPQPGEDDQQPRRGADRDRQRELAQERQRHPQRDADRQVDEDERDVAEADEQGEARELVDRHREPDEQGRHRRDGDERDRRAREERDRALRGERATRRGQRGARSGRSPRAAPRPRSPGSGRRAARGG